MVFIPKTPIGKPNSRKARSDLNTVHEQMLAKQSRTVHKQTAQTSHTHKHTHTHTHTHMRSPTVHEQPFTNEALFLLNTV